MTKYDNKTKYKIIDEVCNGKAAIDIQREYGIGATAVMHWLRTFAENGPFKGDKLTPKDYAWLEKLQKWILSNIFRKININMVNGL